MVGHWKNEQQVRGTSKSTFESTAPCLTKVTNTVVGGFAFLAQAALAPGSSAGVPC